MYTHVTDKLCLEDQAQSWGCQFTQCLTVGQLHITTFWLLSRLFSQWAHYFSGSGPCLIALLGAKLGS